MVERWIAAWLDRDGKFGTEELKEHALFPVTVPFWKQCEAEIKARRGSKAVLLALTPIEEDDR